MAVTAWKFPTAEGQIDSGWVNPELCYADDGSVAAAYVQVLPDQDYHTFGFTTSDIPAVGSVTVDGIEVEVEAYVQVAGVVIDHEVFMVKAGAKAGTSNTHTWTNTAPETHIFGGPTDLWGTTWIPDQINLAAFGQWQGLTWVSGGADSNDRRLRVDYVRIRVYFHHEQTTSVSTKVYPGAIQTTDWYSPASEGQIDSEWTKPAFAYTSNDAHATATGSAALADEQDYYNFGISAANIPAGSTITDIEVSIEAQVTAGNMVSLDTQLVKAGAKVGDVESLEFSWTETSDTTKATAKSDSWGTTWTVAQLEASTFGVHCTAVLVAGGVGTINIDHIKLRINYVSGGIISVARSIASTVTLNVLDRIVSVARTTTMVLSMVINPTFRWRVGFGASPGSPPGTEKEIEFDGGIEKSIPQDTGTEKS